MGNPVAKTDYKSRDLFVKRAHESIQRGDKTIGTSNVFIVKFEDPGPATIPFRCI